MAITSSGRTEYGWWKGDFHQTHFFNSRDAPWLDTPSFSHSRFCLCSRHSARFNGHMHNPSAPRRHLDVVWESNGALCRPPNVFRGCVWSGVVVHGNARIPPTSRHISRRLYHGPRWVTESTGEEIEWIRITFGRHESHLENEQRLLLFLQQFYFLLSS